jgi:hypothetical protein
VEPAELERLIAELEVAVDRLRSLYDQYFMGIEKLEPGVPRKEVDRRIHALRKEQIRNTAMRFRFQMILQRYNTYQTHWQRICREIENGTYIRHRLRAEGRATAARSSTPAPAPQATSAQPAAAPMPSGDVPAQAGVPIPVVLPLRPAAPVQMTAGAQAPAPSKAAIRPGAPGVPPPLPPGAKRAAAAPAGAGLAPPAAVAPGTASPAAGAPAAAPAAGAPRAAPAVAQPAAPGQSPPRAASPPRKEEALPEYRVRQLYVDYVETKRRLNESTAQLTYESLAQSLRESSARLQQKHGKAVDFDVSVKDGKAILKPRLK